MATAWGSLESDSRAMAAALYHIYSGLVTLARHKQGQSERHKHTKLCASEFGVLSCPVQYQCHRISFGHCSLCCAYAGVCTVGCSLRPRDSWPRLFGYAIVYTRGLSHASPTCDETPDHHCTLDIARCRPAGK